MPATPFLAVCFPNMKHSYDEYTIFLRKNHKRIAKKKFCIKIKIESDDEKRRNIVGEK